MVKKALLLLSAIVCLAGNIHAQFVCGTDEVYRELVKKHPEIALMQAQFNEQVRQELKQHIGKYAKITGAQDVAPILNIPLVVHIIHNYGPENISDNDIYTAVKYWAVVYMKQNADTSDVITPFKKYIGNPRIHLQLATIDPLGRPTKGVTRHFSYLTYGGGDQSKLDQWPPDQYVNIWFVNVFNQQNAMAAAYAYLPASGNSLPEYDGVIGLYNYINRDKAIPHEIGHVLNLLHPWGTTNNPDVACGDDEVDDTPPTKGHNPVSSSSDCNPLNFDPTSPLWDTTCATGYFKLYPSAIPGVDSLQDYPDTTNAQNIMDYTYCQRMFTRLQVERMRISLNAQLANRNKLMDSANLVHTGVKDTNGNYISMPDLPPVAEFSMEKGTAPVSGSALVGPDRAEFLCAGISSTNPSFTFKNQSWNDTVSSVQWTFSNGANIATSTSMTTVINQFSTPGWVSATLVATSNAGSDTIVQPHAVYAADPASPVTNYDAEFAANDRDRFPIFNYYNNNFKWEFDDHIGFYDHTSIRYDGYDTRAPLDPQLPGYPVGKPIGDFDDFFTPAFDLSAIPLTGPCYLNFMTAGAYTTNILTEMNDTLEIAYSSNCGQTWVTLSKISNQDISNNGTVLIPFAPSVLSDWKLRNFSIPVRSNKMFFRFRYRPGTNANEYSTSNNFYIDRINVSSFPLGLNTLVAGDKGIIVAPNPTTSNAYVVIKGDNGAANVVVTDVTGKIVYHAQTQLNGDMSRIEIPATAIPVKGMYMVQVITDSQTHTEKLVVY